MNAARTAPLAAPLAVPTVARLVARLVVPLVARLVVPLVVQSDATEFGRLYLMGTVCALSNQTARSFDRAVLIWGMTITAMAALGGDGGVIVPSLALSLAPIRLGIFRRSALIIAALLVYFLGQTALVAGVPVALAVLGLRMAALALFSSL